MVTATVAVTVKLVGTGYEADSEKYGDVKDVEAA